VKVLYLNPAGGLGGAERALLDLMASVRAANPDWHLSLIASAEGDLLEEARALGVAVQSLPFPPVLAASGDAAAGGPAGNHMGVWGIVGRLGAGSPALAMYTRRLARRVNEQAPDVVHTNGFKMHLLGAWAVRRVPIIWHVHDFVRARPLMSRLLALHAGRCAAIIANSAAVAADVHGVLGGRIPVFTVHNAVDLDRFSPEGPLLDLDALAGMERPTAGVVRIGLIATMARWKGHETFIRALAAMASRVPWRAYVIGAPVYQTAGSQYTVDELKSLAAQFDIASRIGFTGFVRDAAAAMRSLDVVVHASTAPEPFGLVIAEAMACGRALVASAVGGAAEIVTPGETALTHAPGDVADLARQLDLLVGDGELRGRLGRAGRTSALNRFTRARLGAEISAIYRESAARAAAA
jgi:glycosyltransferase involved in cell wall biosynthesis